MKDIFFKGDSIRFKTSEVISTSIVDGNIQGEVILKFESSGNISDYRNKDLTLNEEKLESLITGHLLKSGILNKIKL